MRALNEGWLKPHMHQPHTAIFLVQPHTPAPLEKSAHVCVSLNKTSDLMRLEDETTSAIDIDICYETVSAMKLLGWHKISSDACIQSHPWLHNTRTHTSITFSYPNLR
jgi:hypothetical protein